MQKETISFSVQMTVKEVYKFTMYHVYHKMSGFIAFCISLGAFIILLTSFDSLTEQSRAVLILLAAWFILIDPMILLVRARGQVKRNKTYKQPLNYEVNQNGVTVSQGELEQTIGWEQLVQIVETKSQYLLYSSNINAFIFPKSAIGEDCSAFEDMILCYTEGNRVKLKGAIKKQKK